MTRPLHTLLPALIAALLAGAPSSATATDDAARARLQAQVATGQRHFKAGRYREALAAFDAALDGGRLAAGDARLHWNIGRCHEELGDPARALAAFDLAARLADDADFRAQATERITALEARHFGILDVACADGGRVRVEGMAGEKRCPARWDRVRAGRHGGTLVDPDGQTRFAVAITAGAEARVDLTRADLEVDCDAGVVQVTGLVDLRPCPGKWSAVPVGRYAGEHRAPDGRVRAFEVAVRPVEGGRARLTTPGVAEADAGFGPWPWITGGVGVAVLGGSIWFAVEASDALEVANTTPDGDRYDEAIERFERDRAGFYATLGIGVALVATSATLFALDGDDDPSTALGRPTANGWGWRW